jgi:hypothetical protein
MLAATTLRLMALRDTPAVAALSQHFVGRNLDLAFGFVSQARPLHLHLAVRQLDTASL